MQPIHSLQISDDAAYLFTKDQWHHWECHLSIHYRSMSSVPTCSGVFATPRAHARQEADSPQRQSQAARHLPICAVADREIYHRPWPAPRSVSLLAGTWSCEHAWAHPYWGCSLSIHYRSVTMQHFCSLQISGISENATYLFNRDRWHWWGCSPSSIHYRSVTSPRMQPIHSLQTGDTLRMRPIHSLRALSLYQHLGVDGKAPLVLTAL